MINDVFLLKKVQELKKNQKIWLEKIKDKSNLDYKTKINYQNVQKQDNLTKQEQETKKFSWLYYLI